MNAMVRIGKISLDAPFFQAGLAGYSDAAMRLIARQHGCPYCVSEAMLDHFLINGGRGLEKVSIDDRDHPIAGQLMGSHPDEIVKGARILLTLGYDVIDVNLACPVKKIRKKCRGGHLLSAPDQAIAILDAVRCAVGDDAPCTVKLRRGSDDSPQAEAGFHQIFEKVIDLKYAAAVVHGRTVEQKYVGPSRWAFLSDLTRRYGDTPDFVIGGSGDIWQAADVFAMMRQTGVGLVSVARGCIGNPWLFKQARALQAGDHEAACQPPSIHQQRDVLLEHFHLSAQLHGEKRASMMMRKFGIKFAAHHPRGHTVKQAFIAVRSLDDWQQVLKDHYAIDGTGQAIDNESSHTATSASACQADQVAAA